MERRKENELQREVKEKKIYREEEKKRKKSIHTKLHRFQTHYYKINQYHSNHKLKSWLRELIIC